MTTSIAPAVTSMVKKVTSEGFRRLFLAKCRPSRIPNATEVVIKKLEFDINLRMYFDHYEAYVAHDPDKICKTGDIVLVEELSSRMTRDITHKVHRVIYPLGDTVDPITNKPCVGIHYRDEMERVDQLWGKNPKAFDYNKSPPRGSQEGKLDWTHKKGFRKFHEFPDRDQTEAQL